MAANGLRNSTAAAQLQYALGNTASTYYGSYCRRYFKNESTFLKRKSFSRDTSLFKTFSRLNIKFIKLGKTISNFSIAFFPLLIKLSKKSLKNSLQKKGVKKKTKQHKR